MGPHTAYRSQATPFKWVRDGAPGAPMARLVCADSVRQYCLTADIVLVDQLFTRAHGAHGAHCAYAMDGLARGL